MSVDARCGDSKQVLDAVVIPLEVPFYAILHVSSHDARQRDDNALTFLESSNFSVDLSEIRDSNHFL